MKFTLLLFSILLLLCNCTNSKFDPNAKATKIATFEYQCPDAQTNDAFFTAFKNKIERWEGEVTITGIAMVKNPEQFNLHIAEVADETAFLEYLQTPIRLRFAETYRINHLPHFSEILKDSSISKASSQPFMPNAILMYGALEDTAIISQLLKKGSQFFPKNVIWKWGKVSGVHSANAMFPLYALKGNSTINNVHIETAISEMNDYTGEPQLTLNFNTKGTQIWKKMTTMAYNDNNNQIAIMLNDEIVSVPKVMSPILDGQASVLGDFTEKELEMLANNFQDGEFNNCHLKIVSIKNTN